MYRGRFVTAVRHAGRRGKSGDRLRRIRRFVAFVFFVTFAAAFSSSFHRLRRLLKVPWSLSSPRHLRRLIAFVFLVAFVFLCPPPGGGVVVLTIFCFAFFVASSPLSFGRDAGAWVVRALAHCMCCAIRELAQGVWPIVFVE